MSTFICYSRSDEEVALALHRELVKNDIKAWIDQVNIPPGANWQESIEAAINNSKYLIILLSKNSVNSREVEAEWNLAIELNKTIIPILFAEVNVPFRLRTYQFLNYQELGLEKTILKLLEVIPKAKLKNNMIVDEYDDREHINYASFSIKVKRGKFFLMKPDAYRSFSDLANEMFLEFLSDTVSPYSYGKEWVIMGGTKEAIVPVTDYLSGARILLPLLWLENSRVELEWLKSITPNQLGVLPGTHWMIILMKDKESIFVNNAIGAVTNSTESAEALSDYYNVRMFFQEIIKLSMVGDLSKRKHMKEALQFKFQFVITNDRVDVKRMIFTYE